LAAFAVALALGAVAVSSAFAAPEWYSSTSKPTPEWQQGGAKLTEAVATKSKGSVTLADVGESAKVECTVTGEGTAGPGAVDKDTSLSLSGCFAPAKARNSKGEEVTNNCEKVVKAELQGVPWRTELTIRGGSFYDAITHESKELAFEIACKVLGGSLEVVDKCGAGGLSFAASISNVVGGVDSTFDNEGIFLCSLTGGDTGEIGGTQLVEATKGGTLEVKMSEPTYSKITSTHEVTDAGELTIEDKGTKTLGARCNFFMEGTIKTAGKGTITSFSEGCTPIASCTKLEKTEAIGLPWETELYESGGVIRERILSSGKGTPAWAFTCTGTERDECPLNVSPEILSKGLEANVFAVFSETLTKTTCKLGGSEKGVWKGELEVAPTSGSIRAKK
jgi:hypothetical protein